MMGYCILSGRGLQYRGVLTGRIQQWHIEGQTIRKSLNKDFAIALSKEITLEKIEKHVNFGEAIKITGIENEGNIL